MEKSAPNSLEEMNLFIDHIAKVCGVTIPISVEVKGFDLPGTFLDISPDRCVATEIVNALPGIVNEDVAEALIRYLAGCRFTFDGHPLMYWYDKSTDYLFKWTVANTLSFGRAVISVDWLLDTMRKPGRQGEKQMLYDALTHYLPRLDARKIIEEKFDEEPVHAISALLKLRDIGSIPFLETKATQLPYANDSWYQRRFESVIEKIRKRPRKTG